MPTSPPTGGSSKSSSPRKFRPANGYRLSERRLRKGERGIWQRRFWEHVIRDEKAFEAHVDYIHYSPVKHGWARQAADWPYSSFSRYVERGIYPADWAAPEAVHELSLE